MALVDARVWQEQQAFTEQAAVLRERAVSLLAEAQGAGVFSLLATDAGKAALDKLTSAALALNNALAAFHTAMGTAAAADALVEAATAYRDARAVVDVEIERAVERRLAIDDEPLSGQQRGNAGGNGTIGARYP